MISHIHIGIGDFDRAFAFYAAVLPVLGLEQKFSEPIQATNGVYVIYVNDVVDAPAPDAGMVKSQQDNRINQAKGQVESFVTEALKTKYKVKDLRYRF